MVCGMTAGAADLKILNQPVTFELNRIVRFEFKSNLEASQVANFHTSVRRVSSASGLDLDMCLHIMQGPT